MNSFAEKIRHIKSARQFVPHECHWPGCKRQVPPAMWGCRSHWFALPLNLRTKILKAYQPGQELSKRPSPEYVAAAHEVQEWIAGYVATLRYS